MGADQHFDWLGTAASTLDWWREAGVDVLVDDLPRDWFAAPAPIVQAAPAPLADAAAPPDDLAAFIVWRVGDEAPEMSWRGVSIAATGPADARVMVLVDCPDSDDGAAGMLMAGAVGRLFDRMLAAIGLSRETVHLAAVCARRPLARRMPAETAARLSELSLHHVGLVAPERLLLLGDAASRAVLGADRAASQGSLRPLNHKGGETGVVASFHPRFLLENPAAKAVAWRDLQLLMGDKSS